jgi:hypothetical protein
MQWWQFALLGAAGGVIIEALEIFRGLSQWQRARRDRNGRLKRLPAKLGQFVDGPAHAYMLPARAVLGAGAAVLFGMTGQVTGAYGVVAFGCAAPVLLTQLGHIPQVQEAVDRAPRTQQKASRVRAPAMTSTSTDESGMP